MPRPNQSETRRARLVARLTATFAELGYRRATTAELARRCGVQETTLYRLWPDKRAMFVAALEFVATNSRAIWERVLRRRQQQHTTAEQLLAYEAEHLGEFGLYRILFAGWSETDDPAIHKGLCAVYATFLEFLDARVVEHRRERPAARLPDSELTAWALIGLGTAVNIGRELGLLPEAKRRRLMAGVGRHLLG